jgi:spore coat polysaccharide biosynthesis protein SpsF (cytidylyltransferase family)
VGSTRLPGKVLEPIEGKPLLEWTVAGVQAIPGIAGVVVATTTDPADDAVALVAARLDAGVHRGSATDVLSRCHDAVAPFEPDIVVRQTADNPFPDPSVAAAQVGRLIAGTYDYVGIDGWPLGIAAEACRMTALVMAAREATDPADREHVMPFLYRQSDRFRIGWLERRAALTPDGRYTVDTAADLAFARALAARLHHGPPVALRELEAIVAGEPELLDINADVVQQPSRTIDRGGAVGA